MLNKPLAALAFAFGLGLRSVLRLSKFKSTVREEVPKEEGSRRV